MQEHIQSTRRRGRPPRSRDDLIDARQLILRAGLALLTEKGFSATGLEEILSLANTPRGSFYHYFSSKEAFGLSLIEHYGDFFSRRLDRFLDDSSLSPLNRIHAFVKDSKTGMARHHFRRGCLIGNLGQEMGSLPESFRRKLKHTFETWQARFSACLKQAQQEGEIAASVNTDQLAAFFWIGWEGAVLRSKLERSVEPLEIFERFFFAQLPHG